MLTDTPEVAAHTELSISETDCKDCDQNPLKDVHRDEDREAKNGFKIGENLLKSQNIELQLHKDDGRNNLSDQSENETVLQSDSESPLKDISRKPCTHSENVHLEMNKWDADPDTLCGIGNFKPQWMQKWATARTFLVLHSIIGVIGGSYYSYRIGVMSTLEKRFAFKSKTSGAIMIFDEITPLFLGPLTGYFGGKMHRPRILGIGMLMSVACNFLSAFPYFIYGTSVQHVSISSIQNGTGPELCDSGIRTQHCDSDDRPPTVAAIFFWMLAGILKGFGNLANNTVGLSYMDDIAKKKNTPMYFAISFVLRLFGPLLGFLMSSICLKYYENPFDDPGYGPEDPRWIGGWWMGFALQGVLLLIVTIPISFFPRRLPGQKKQTSDSHDRNKKSFKSDLTGLFSALKRLFKNPLFIAVILTEIISVYATVGHHVNLPKYMEHQFRLSASDASLYSGPPGIAAVMVSILAGGYTVWKFRPSIRFILAGMMTMEAISAVAFILLMIPKCEKLELSNYGFSPEGLILQDTCNENCNCSTKTFNPTCGPDGRTLYFSPCYAGCELQNSNKTFSNCSCVPDQSPQQRGYVTEGYCMSEQCWSQAIIYIITWPLFQVVVSFFRVAYTIILLRSIHPKDKSLALGTFEALTCTLGFVPYLIIFGAMVDSACLVWEESCGETGNCWFYDIDKFNNILHGMSAGFSALSVLATYLTYRLRGRMYDLYEDDADLDTEAGKEVDKSVRKNQEG